MKISRTTVAKYFKNYEDSKSKLMGCDDVKIKEDIISPPKYNSAARVKVKLTDQIIEEIGSYLKENEEKRAKVVPNSRKKRLIYWKCCMKRTMTSDTPQYAVQ
jgi:hypothetical protein